MTKERAQQLLSKPGFAFWFRWFDEFPHIRADERGINPVSDSGVTIAENELVHIYWSMMSDETSFSNVIEQIAKGV